MVSLAVPSAMVPVRVSSTVLVSASALSEQAASRPLRLPERGHLRLGRLHVGQSGHPLRRRRVVRTDGCAAGAASRSARAVAASLHARPCSLPVGSECPPCCCIRRPVHIALISRHRKSRQHTGDGDHDHQLDQRKPPRQCRNRIRRVALTVYRYASADCIGGALTNLDLTGRRPQPIRQREATEHPQSSTPSRDADSQRPRSGRRPHAAGSLLADLKLTKAHPLPAQLLLLWQLESSKARS